MNHWEDKEGLLPTKTTLCGEYNRRTKAPSLEQQPIPDEPGPEPSCVSVKSDWSNGRLIDFRPQQPSAANRIHSDSPAPSCMSFKSNRSKLEPITFRDGPEQQVDQEGLEVPCSPPTQQHQAHLDSIIMLLEENIVTFVKNELKKIQKVLRSDYPECSESQWEDEGVLDSEDEEQRRSSREAFLKISLHFLRKMKQEELADRLQRNSCELTLDTNTLNRHLKLSDNNRMVTSVKEVQSYSYHPDRFDWWEQVLCRTGLTGRCYWEVEWRGGVYISVSYKGISRKGDGEDCEFGGNEKSWSLSCSGVCYSVCHNNRETKLSSSFFSPFSSSSVFNRVAVYVDCPAGTLSFYSVSSGTLIHLYTFNTTFTEPLYPGFGFGFWSGSSVSLCSLVGLRDSSY